jgi:hypothetical protein
MWDEIATVATVLLEETALTPKRTRSIVHAAFQQSLKSKRSANDEN